MPRPSEQETQAGLSRMLNDWAAASDPDGAITVLLKRAIKLQEGDTDDPNDAKVLAGLRSALEAQEANNRNETMAGAMTCPLCGEGKVTY